MSVASESDFYFLGELESEVLEMFEMMIVFIYSALVGTFLAARIARIPNKQKLSLGRIHCSECRSKIRLHKRIPIFGYLLSRGICERCHAKMSRQNFLVELLTAVFSIPIYIKYGFSVETMFFMLLFYSLIVIAFIDWKHLIIPKQATRFIFVLGLFYILYDVAVNFNTVQSHIFGMLIVSLPLYLFASTLKGSIGMGDVKLFAIAGLFVGQQLIVLTFIIAMVMVGVVKVLGNFKMREQIPFGPYICFGIYLSMLVGNNIITWLSR